jgi:hypothetical protein
MGKTIRLAAACLASLAGLACAADPASMRTAKDLKWTDAAQPKGAKQAVLWGDEKTSENAVLARWPFNTKLADVVRDQDVRIVVLAGTFTAEVDGGYREFGPSGVILIPKGTKHSLGCEAAGECRFLMQHPGAVEVKSAK